METTDKAVKALEKTKEALELISIKLEPLLRRRDPDPAVTAAIALALGTLRFMGARLRGLKPGDPLRLQLNQLRTLLRKAQTQQKKQKSEKSKRSPSTATPKQPSTEVDKSSKDASIESPVKDRVNDERKLPSSDASKRKAPPQTMNTSDDVAKALPSKSKKPRKRNGKGKR
jgi:hypothetical protein